ncbi:MAG: hypothetical protein RL038_964 [Actinomycetota bacterium]
MAAIVMAATNISGVSGVEYLANPKTVKVQKFLIKYSNSQKTSISVNAAIATPKSAKPKFQWLRNGSPIKGAVAKAYRVKPADAGSVIKVRMTVKVAGYKTLVRSSNGIQVPLTVDDSYELLWSDEFDASVGALADTSKWVGQNGDGCAAPYNNCGWGNSELQYYRFENAVHSGNGTIKLHAKRAGADSYECYYGECIWQSAKLVTKDKFAFKYGRIEARIKGAAGEGTWPAFWTLGTNIDTVPWPRCGEIDIMELKGSNPSYVWGTAHGPLSGGPGRGGSKFLNTSASKAFHTYAVEWTPSAIRFYVDGSLYYTYTKSDADWVFDDYQYLILNVAMGGHWGGAIDFDLMESNLEVDYVRYYSIDGLGELKTY